MMNITKTTINFATKRNIELVIDADLVSFYDMNDDSEPMITYSINDEDGTMNYKANIWLDRSTKEELPAWIQNEKQLREVINFISNEI